MAHLAPASPSNFAPVGGGMAAAVGGFDAGAGVQIGRNFAPLGTITKSAASRIYSSFHATKSVAPAKPVGKVNYETGEITPFKRTFEDNRQARYSLHKAFREIEPHHRTAQCQWCAVSPEKTVQVSIDEEYGRARYNNLRTCGRVWHCPFCAAKISERRATELAGAMAVARSQGLNVALLTCTVPHVRQDSLKSLLNGLVKAWSRLVDNRAGKAIRADLGLVGTIRNIETTCGLNSWHPHFHCLVFYKNNVDLSEIEARWSAQWQHVCVKSGLRRPSDEHGLTLQDGSFADKYVSKWGLEHEVTKSMQKTSRKHGRTPFDILRDYESGIDRDENAQLFREFVAAFHGVRQLVWSPHLKKMLSVEEVSDQQLAVREDERPTRLVCELNQAQWMAVRRHHRAALLTMAEKNPADIPDFLDTLVAVVDSVADRMERSNQ